MTTFIYIFAKFAQIMISAVSYAIVIRAVLSIFSEPDGVLLSFFVVLTEPVILPVRAAMDRVPAFEAIPFDAAPLGAVLLLNLIRGFLPAI